MSILDIELTYTALALSRSYAKINRTLWLWNKDNVSVWRVSQMSDVLLK